MLLFVENKRIFAGLSVSRWGWWLHDAGLERLSVVFPTDQWRIFWQNMILSPIHSMSTQCETTLLSVANRHRRRWRRDAKKRAWQDRSGASVSTTPGASNFGWRADRAFEYFMIRGGYLSCNDR